MICNQLFCRLLAVAVVVGCWPATAAQAESYFVRTSGDDSKNGKDPSKAFRTIQKAANVVNAGDTVYVGAGTYNEYVVLTRDGTATKSIDFVADKTGAQTGDAGNVNINIGVSAGGDYWTMTGFRVFGNGRPAFSLQAANYTTLTDCEVYGGSHGIYLSDSKVSVTSCTVHDVSSAGLVIGDGAQADVSGTTVYNGQYGVYLFGLSASARISTLQLSRSILRNCSLYGYYIASGTGTLTNCLLHDQGKDGVRLEGGTSTINHCTITRNENGIETKGGSNTLINSIVAFNRDDGLDCDSGPLTHTYNLVFGNQDDDFDGTSKHATEIVADPKFVGSSDYRLQAGSPAIDKGTGSLNIDRLGNSRPAGAAVDMGCHEADILANTYYVSTNGNDSNTGLSVAQAFRTIGKAGSVVNPGEKVLVSGGVYKERPTLSRAGTLAKPILFQANSGATVVMQLPDDGASSWNLLVYASHLQFKGLTFTGEGRQWNYGVYCSSAAPVTFDNCIFKFLGYGLHSYQSDLRVMNCAFRNNEWTALYPYLNSAKTQITNTVVENNKGWGVLSYGDLTVDNCQLKTNAGWAVGSINGELDFRNQTQTITGNGGGLYLWDDRKPVKSRSVDNWDLSGNGSALVLGGGGKFTVKNCKLNNSTGWMMHSYSADVTFENTETNGNAYGVYAYSPDSYGGKTTLRNLNMSDSKHYYGVLSYYGNLTLENCKFLNNPNAHAIYHHYGPLLVDKCKIDKNGGWGVIAVNCELEFRNMAQELKNNGGGLYIWDDRKPVKTRAIENWDLSNNGSALCLGGGGKFTVKNCKLNNSTGWMMHSYSADVTFENTETNGNAYGVYAYAPDSYGGKTTLRNLNMSDSKHYYGVLSYYGNLTLENCKFLNNPNAHAIYHHYGPLLVDRCQIDKNGGWAVIAVNSDLEFRNTAQVLKNNGGGLYIWDDRKPVKTRVIENWDLSNNGSALVLGGGGKFTVKNCKLNNSTGWMMHSYSADVTFEKTETIGNAYGVYAYSPESYGGKTTLRNLDMCDSKHYYGVLSYYGNLTLENCKFLNNPNAHAIYHHYGPLLVDNCKIDKNGGWGVIAVNCELEFRNTAQVLKNNGGGLYIWDDRKPVKTRTIENWDLSSNGSALCLGGGGKFTVKNCKLNNSTGWMMHSYSADVTFENTETNGNAYGVYAYSPESYGGKTTLRNLNLSDSKHYYGVLSYYGNLTLENCKFLNNPNAHAIYHHYGPLLVDNCKIDKNGGWGVIAVNCELEFRNSAQALKNNGGGLYIWDDRKPVQTRVIENWDLSNNGSALCLGGGGKFLVKNCDLRNSSGWMMHSYSSETTFENVQTSGSAYGVYAYSPESYGNKTTLRNLRLEGLTSYYGVLSYYGTLTLDNCQIVNNPSANAVYHHYGPLVLDRCAIDKNGGWGVIAVNNEIELRNQSPKISGNGGGLYVYDDRPRTSPREIRNWTLTGNGTGLQVYGGSFLIENNTVSNNSSWGMVSYYCDLQLKNQTLSNNGHGALIYAWSPHRDTKVAIDNCHFDNNSGWHGLLTYYGKTTIKNSTFNGNQGDGLYTVYDPLVTAENCQFNGNKRWGTVNHVNYPDTSSYPFLQNNVQTMKNCTVDGNAYGSFVYNAKNANFTATNTSITNNTNYSMFLQDTQYTLDGPRDGVVVKGNGYGPFSYGTLSDVTLKNSAMEDCKIHGPLVYYGKLRMENCTTTGANYYGLYWYRPKLMSCANSKFTGGSGGWASHGYGGKSDTTAPVVDLRNNTFHGYSHGLHLYAYLDAAEPARPTYQMLNNTYSNLAGYGLYVHQHIDAIAKNNIFHRRTGASGHYGLANVSNGTLTHSHNLMSGFDTPFYSVSDPDETTVFKSPRFANLANGDLHLASGSPAINSGTNTTTSLVSSDMDGNTRPLFKVVDIGAYECTSDSSSVRILEWKEKK